MSTWEDGRVSVADSVTFDREGSGMELRDSFVASIRKLTFGLVSLRENSFRLGPLELLRFGRPMVTKAAVEWPIEGGYLAASPGGSWRLEVLNGRLVASASGYQPRLPRAIYILTQLPVHRLLTRLYLLRTRGRVPAPGRSLSTRDRYQAAAVDVAFCAALTFVVSRPHRLRTFVGISAGYYLACWSLSGRTLGGLVMKQRVVASDGSRLIPEQALVRLLALPVSWVRRRPDHDWAACTDVIGD